MTWDKKSERERATRWERMMKVFYTMDVASIGVVFDTGSKVEFYGKPVASIALCQYISNNANGNGNGNCHLAQIMSSNAEKETCIKEPKNEMNGIFVRYGNSTNSQPEEIDMAFLPEVIAIVNGCDVSRYFIDKQNRDMTFWFSGASLDRCWYSSLEELEKYDEHFKAAVSDELCVPDDIAAYIYFEPKVRELLELIEGCSDASGKADAMRVQILLRHRMNLNDDEAWAVFDYALKLGLFEEVDNVYARATGEKPRVLPEKYDDT